MEGAVAVTATLIDLPFHANPTLGSAVTDWSMDCAKIENAIGQQSPGAELRHGVAQTRH